MNVTCTKKNFDTILIHIPNPSKNARVQSLAHCRFTRKWLWQWETKLTSSSCCWKYVKFTCPTLLGCYLASLEHDVILWDIMHGFLSTKNAHRVALFRNLNSSSSAEMWPHLNHFWPHLKNGRHAEHLCIYFTMGFFDVSGAVPPKLFFGDSLIPMVIVYIQNTSRKNEDFGTQSH